MEPIFYKIGQGVQFMKLEFNIFQSIEIVEDTYRNITIIFIYYDIVGNRNTALSPHMNSVFTAAKGFFANTVLFC